MNPPRGVEGPDATLVPGTELDGSPVAVVISCEHGGNDVPARYAGVLASPTARRALESHRGWDPGSVEIGRAMARILAAPLAVQRVTRLLVDCNRSLGHPRLFSDLVRGLSEGGRAELIDRYWRPHRDGVRALIDGAPSEATVVHVGVHTFTPVWNRRTRSTDLGLLYDPRRRREATLVRGWRRDLLRSWAVAHPRDSPPRIHLNRPYRGWTDGLTTTLRSELPESRYVGIELEVSQRLLPPPGGLGESLASALESAARGLGGA